MLKFSFETVNILHLKTKTRLFVCFFLKFLKVIEKK